MKKVLVFIYALLIVAATIAQTPVAYYPFNGNANDAAGTLNGTVNGATLTADRFGNANSAYSFDGIDDFIGTTGLAISQNQNWTISAWVKAASLSQAGTFIVLNGFSNSSSGNGYAMTVLNADNTGAGNVFKLHYPGQVLVNSGFTFNNINTWHHVVITRDISAIGKMYFDGVLSATTTNASINPTGGDFRIGSATSNGFWDGAIDEVKVYNNALTDAQVQAEYTATSQVPKPGSGNAISFDGGDDFVDIPNAANLNFGTSQDFVVETWVKIPVSQNFTTSTDNIIIDKWGGFGSGSAYPFSIRFQNIGSPDANKITVFRTNDIGGGAGINSLNAMNDNKWHHIAFAKNGNLLSLYVDGVLNGTTPDVTAGNTGNSATATIGRRNGGTASAFFTGSMDEVRIWNTALTQAQIRDRMCRKITSSDALYPNLVAYYNFDESTGNTAFDATGNNNSGTLTNSPTRVASGAAIGNASSHDYVNATKTTSLTHPTGESFTVTSTSGNPDGIQIYRVDEQPSTLNGAAGVGSNDKYFGVFQVNGTTPQYTAVYNYNGNPGVNAGNENQLRLNKRSDNAATSWTTMATIPDEPNNTITITGESTEYILGKLGAPLPLNLISFSGSKQNNDVLLQWKTANEIGVSKFEVQRSNDGQTFATIGTIAAGGSLYSLTDANIFSSRTVAFYRVKSIDVDDRFTYSNIIKLIKQTSAAVTVYPNPVSDVLSISGLQQKGTVLLYSAEGKLLQQQIVTAQTMTIDMSKYAKGIYLLQCKRGDEVANQKIIKQ